MPKKIDAQLRRRTTRAREQRGAGRDQGAEGREPAAARGRRDPPPSDDFLRRPSASARSVFHDGPNRIIADVEYATAG